MGFNTECNIYSAAAPVRDYGSSGLNAEMLEYWEVTEGRKLHYQSSNQK